MWRGSGQPFADRCILDPTLEERVIRTLTVMGDELGLILDKSLLERLNLGPDTPLELRVEGQTLIVRAAGEEGRRARIREATGKMMDAHAETLRKLAL
jgi:antitoxin MazE